MRSRASYQTRAGAPASPGIRVKSDGPECPSPTGCAIPRSAIRETTILQGAFSGLKPAKTIRGYGTTEVVRFADSSGCDLCGNAGRRRGACSAWIGKSESKSKPRTDKGVRLTPAVPHSSSATHEPSPQWHSTDSPRQTPALPPLRLRPRKREMLQVVGFRGSGYQRSLPVPESGAYNF